MSFSNYTDLQAAVLAFNWARSSGTVTDFIRLAHTKINLGLRVPFMEKTASLTISADRIAAPTDMAAVRRLWIDGTYDNPLQPTSPDRILDLRATYSSAQPQWYAIEGDTTTGTENTTEGEYFVFGPSPGTTSYTGKLLYTRRLAALSSGSDTNIVLDRYPNLYLYGALAEAAAFSDETERLATYGAMFSALIAQINEQARSDAYAGGSPAMTTGYGLGQF